MFVRVYVSMCVRVCACVCVVVYLKAYMCSCRMPALLPFRFDQCFVQHSNTTLCACICASCFHVIKAGQNRIYAPYMTVCLVISLPKITYIP